MRWRAVFPGPIPLTKGVSPSRSGGKPRLGRISQMGNRELRKLLIVGALGTLYIAQEQRDLVRRSHDRRARRARWLLPSDTCSPAASPRSGAVRPIFRAASRRCSSEP
jgi:hypothetical protein